VTLVGPSACCHLIVTSWYSSNMRFLCVTLAVALAPAGCSSRSAPSTVLTSGVTVQLPGCAYTFTTPDQTTAPTNDDGFIDAMPTARDLHLSWVGDPSTTTTITWNGDFGTTSTLVEYGATSAYGQKASGFSFAYPTDLAGSDPPSVRVHQVHLCGLQPATTYHYRVGPASIATADATFTTAPAGAARTRVLVAGDSRGNVATWAQVLQTGATETPDFAIFTGDANDLGTIQDEWEAWFGVGASVLPNVHLMMAMGNHEINSRHYYSQFPLPANQQWYDSITATSTSSCSTTRRRIRRRSPAPRRRSSIRASRRRPRRGRSSCTTSRRTRRRSAIRPRCRSRWRGRRSTRSITSIWS
jgi:hypothetical protein